MNKYIYSIVLTIFFVACTDKQPDFVQQDSAIVDTAMMGNDNQNADSLHQKSYTDKLSSDTLQYCIKDTLPSGEIFYIKSKKTPIEKYQYNDTTTLCLYHYDNGESKLIDTITIEGFYSSCLSNYPDCEWLDTCFILNDTTKAYGHSVYASNTSYENHIMSKRIDFIAITPHSISHIYSDDLSFTDCNDYMSEHEDCEGTTKSFKTTNTKSNGYYDIIVTEQKWHEVMKGEKREEYSNSISTYKLKYKNGKYEK